MAIPVRVTITCPNCGVSEDVTFGDTSVGPAGRTSETPIYMMFAHDLWPQSTVEESGQKISYISCASCGEKNFASLPELARRRFIRRPTDSGKKPTLSTKPTSRLKNLSKPISKDEPNGKL